MPVLAPHHSATHNQAPTSAHPHQASATTPLGETTITDQPTLSPSRDPPVTKSTRPSSSAGPRSHHTGASLSVATHTTHREYYATVPSKHEKSERPNAQGGHRQEGPGALLGQSWAGYAFNAMAIQPACVVQNRRLLKQVAVGALSQPLRVPNVALSGTLASSGFGVSDVLSRFRLRQVRGLLLARSSQNA